jgi:hypothetical protein
MSDFASEVPVRWTLACLKATSTFKNLTDESTRARIVNSVLGYSPSDHSFATELIRDMVQSGQLFRTLRGWKNFEVLVELLREASDEALSRELTAIRNIKLPDFPEKGAST